MTLLTAALLTDDAALAALRAEWQALWRRVPHATPFQSPEWLLSWWRQFGTTRPRVAILRDGAGLQGVLPLYILDEQSGRKLLPIGAGLTDYQDALLAPEAPADAADALLAAVLQGAERDGVTACDLIDVPPDAALRRVRAPAGWHAAWHESDPCPVLALPAATTDLRARVPEAALRSVRASRARAARAAGGYQAGAASEHTLPALLESLFRLHEARWGGEGVLRDPRVLAFHREAAPLMHAAGMFRLHVLRIGGTVAAAGYVLVTADRRLLFYISGYDPSRAREGPGSILLGSMIERAAEDGVTELHFLRGGEDYKYAWGGVDRRNAACRLVCA